MSNEKAKIEYLTETGENWLNSQGEPDIDYVAWLENKTALLQSRIKELEDELKKYKSKMPFEDYNKCGKCEMLGDSAPCDECYRKTLKFPTP